MFLIVDSRPAGKAPAALTAHELQRRLVIASLLLTPDRRG